MKNLSYNQTAKNYEDKMIGRKISESATAADIQCQTRKIKRYRSAFTTGQINYLEKQFKKFPYIGNACRKEVANVLNIPERAVKIWFQNRRMKEKKEVTNKDLDRPNNAINNVEFVNDPLNNVHSSQSANDRQCSFQPTVSNRDIKINYMNYNEVKKSDVSNLEKLKRETVEYNKPCQLQNNHINKYENVTTHNKISSSTQPNLFKCNLNRIYNNSNFMKYLETNKYDGVNRNKVKPINKIKEDFKSGTHLSIPQNTPESVNYQDLPEDLSAAKKSNVTIPQNHLQNINLNSAYIPFCSPHNYVTPCVSTGSVIWKPINVMPVIPQSSSNLPLAITENGLSEVNQMNMQKPNCNCNCHMINLLNHSQGNTLMGTPQSQYVIAIPFNKNSN